MIEYAIAFSLHFGLNDHYNGIHPHIRYRNENIIAGVYYNSLKKTSIYIGNRIEVNDFGFEAGVVTGYTGYPAYGIVPYGRITYKNLFLAPAKEATNRIGFLVGYQFKL